MMKSTVEIIRKAHQPYYKMDRRLLKKDVSNFLFKKGEN